MNESHYYSMDAKGFKQQCSSRGLSIAIKCLRLK